MKKASSQLQSHLQQPVTTLAICWNLKLLNGKQIGFTEHDQELYLEEIRYSSDCSLYCSAIENTSGLQPDNLQVQMAMDDNLCRKDIVAGHADGAAIEIFMVNFTDLEAGSIKLFCGNISSIKLFEKHFIAELKSHSDQLNNTIGEVYSPHCRADFCDARCKLSKSGFVKEGNITAVLDEVSFVGSHLDETDGFFSHGVIKMIDGDNAGLTFAIKESYAGTIVLNLPPPYPLAVKDNYIVTAGCDKKFETCCDKFNNAVNFRGEPNIPGYDGLV